MKLFYMNLKNCMKSFRFFFAIFLILYIYIYIAKFPYTIFECLGACFTIILNTKKYFEYEH